MQVDKTIIQLKFKANNKIKEYKVKEIWGNIIYTKRSKTRNYLLIIYY